MAITARLASVEELIHDGVGEFLRCTIAFEENGVAVAEPREHLIPLHERLWTEAEVSAELGRVAQSWIEGLNMVRAQSLDLTAINVGSV